MIRIIAVGKIKKRPLAALVEDYCKRIRPLAPLEIVELRDSNPDKEAREMIARLGSPGGHDVTVALDEKGEAMSSERFARLLAAHGSLNFLIGGPDGLGGEARDRAPRSLRLSRMTFTHEMARVLLVEQIYRGLGILRGKPYHRA